MSKILLKIIPRLIFWVIFLYVVLQVPYPESLTQANLQQLLLFFIPLFLAITLTLNLISKNIFIAGSISLGLIFPLLLKALDSFNLVTGFLILISVALLVSYFKKIKKRNLTKWPKIPKLHAMRKQ